ncbi:IS66 family insertion sequence element accessory protein TnpB [Paracoccus mutanolyticus]|uniref:IS66 family insertion sequence element accessory protein TnpB n=1 Tax=Paracoccus mutanolyticus TaxID=1499308 RepID=UPI001CB9BEDF|nr:IS66 family insertion sequence element accessory protein TnpB [Paracoccus mutanolyticus]
MARRYAVNANLIVKWLRDRRYAPDPAAAHDRAARVGSANSVRRQADGTWYADNFDGVGFIDGLKAGGHRMRFDPMLDTAALTRLIRVVEAA